ncbi:MAG TPA: arginase family protein [Bacteroidales bacterium]|nr:arginase family protein [Bacteroidales bacterium]
MIDFSDYFNPVSIEDSGTQFLCGQASFPHNVHIHTENNPIKDIGRFKVAIIGVPEGRNSANPASIKAPDAIRKALYSLARIPGKLRIIDCGNMKQGVSFNDSIAGLADVITALSSENVVPVILGGSSSLIPSIDAAFSREKFKYDLAAVDPRICYNHEKKDQQPSPYLNVVLHNGRSTLHHFTNIGYQTFLNDQQVINRFMKRKYEMIRVGDVRQSISLMEPLMRDSHAIVFNIAAVRQSDAPGTALPSANGFYGEEICLLSRYAGLSDSIRTFGLFDVNPDFDIREQTAGIAAQIIWFFLEGFSQKQFETPVLKKNSSGRFIWYHVRVTGLEDDLVFVRSSLTERWWMELSAGTENVYVACSHEDYMKANRNEVPERWIKAVERLKN